VAPFTAKNSFEAANLYVQKAFSLLDNEPIVFSAVKIQFS